MGPRKSWHLHSGLSVKCRRVKTAIRKSPRQARVGCGPAGSRWPAVVRIGFPGNRPVRLLQIEHLLDRGVWRPAVDGRQQVAFDRALLQRSRVLQMDEPRAHRTRDCMLRCLVRGTLRASSADQRDLRLRRRASRQSADQHARGRMPRPRGFRRGATGADVHPKAIAVVAVGDTRPLRSLSSISLRRRSRCWKRRVGVASMPVEVRYRLEEVGLARDLRRPQAGVRFEDRQYRVSV